MLQAGETAVFRLNRGREAMLLHCTGDVTRSGILGNQAVVLKEGRGDDERWIRFLGREINSYGLGDFEQRTIHQKCHSVMIENLIAVLGLVQSHRKRKVTSSTGMGYDSYGRIFLPICQKRLHHLCCFFRHFKHRSSPFRKTISYIHSYICSLRKTSLE